MPPNNGEGSVKIHDWQWFNFWSWMEAYNPTSLAYIKNKFSFIVGLKNKFSFIVGYKKKMLTKCGSLYFVMYCNIIINQQDNIILSIYKDLFKPIIQNCCHPKPDFKFWLQSDCWQCQKFRQKINFWSSNYRIDSKFNWNWTLESRLDIKIIKITLHTIYIATPWDN